jgi:hypothetical protein
MFEEGETDTARHLELDSAQEIRCNILFQSAHYLHGVHRYHDRNTSLTRDEKGLSSCTRLHALDLIAYSTVMARRFLIPGISSIYAVFILDQPKHLLLVPRD